MHPVLRPAGANFALRAPNCPWRRKGSSLQVTGSEGERISPWALQPSSGSVEALATIDLFNLDDRDLEPAYSIDGMHARPAIANEPRNYLSSHFHPPPEKGGVPRLFSALQLRLSGDRILQSSAQTCAQLSLRDERLGDKETRFDWEQAQFLKPMTSMHARCVLSCVTSWPRVIYVRPWKSLRNGQQPIATHARMNSSKGLKKQRRHGLASSVSFQPTFGGA